MIINQELVIRIKEHFNLNVYEAKVWLALLSKGVVSAGESAELSGVPRSRTYDVLESLAKRGFAIVKVGKPVKYIAVDPKTVLEKMKTTALYNVQEKVKLLTNLKETQEYKELETLHNSGISPVKLGELSGHIRGRANIISKIKELFTNCEKEISICTTLDDFEDKSRILLPIIQEVNKKGIKMKIALSGNEDRIRRICNKHKLKVKNIDNKGKFYISDKNEVLFMINQEKSDEEVGVWLKSAYFVSSFSGMFDNYLRN